MRQSRIELTQILNMMMHQGTSIHSGLPAYWQRILCLPKDKHANQPLYICYRD